MAAIRPIMALGVVVTAVLLIMFVASDGCADRSLAGKYVGKRAYEGPEHLAGALAKVELELKPDGTFTLLNLSVTYEGRWDVQEDAVRLTILRALGRETAYGVQPTARRVAQGLEFVDSGGLDPRPVVLQRTGAS